MGERTKHDVSDEATGEDAPREPPSTEVEEEADERKADGAAGAKEARTPGMGS